MKISGSRSKYLHLTQVLVAIQINGVLYVYINRARPRCESSPASRFLPALRLSVRSGAEKLQSSPRRQEPTVHFASGQWSLVTRSC
jgi:hypothetical protein